MMPNNTRRVEEILEDLKPLVANPKESTETIEIRKLQNIAEGRDAMRTNLEYLCYDSTNPHRGFEYTGDGGIQLNGKTEKAINDAFGKESASKINTLLAELAERLTAIAESKETAYSKGELESFPLKRGFFPNTPTTRDR